MTTLKLETRGCDFRPNSEEAKLSDLGNYRLCGTNYTDIEIVDRLEELHD